MSLHVSWDEYNTLVERLALRIYESAFAFNQVICIARGGLRVGDVLSRIYELPLAILSTHSYTAEGGTIRGELVIAEHMTMTRPRLGERVLLVDALPAHHRYPHCGGLVQRAFGVQAGLLRRLPRREPVDPSAVRDLRYVAA